MGTDAKHTRRTGRQRRTLDLAALTAGHDVHEILCDYQNLENGGDGWLQTLRFVPKTDEIYVDAYSPVVEKTNRQPKHTYVIPYPMTGRSLKSR